MMSYATSSAIMNIAKFLTNYAHCSDIIQPYIIAEAGVNHEGDMDKAYRLIDAAKEGGADAIKFQTYKASKLAVKESPSYWDLTKESTTSQYQLFKKYDGFWKKEYEKLSSYCDSAGITFLSTPFDLDSASFLNDLMPAFKISSSDLNNKQFIQSIASYGKPIILSTGASYLWEIERSVSWLQDYQIPLGLMHCILNYPTKDENANLSIIRLLHEKFPGITIGYSDHTLPEDMHLLEVAVLAGAKVIEKHFTLDKSAPGNDHYHSMDKNDLIILKNKISRTMQILGSSSNRAPLISEQVARQNARRSLVLSSDLRQGQLIQSDHITWKRPAFGIDPDQIDQVIGLRVRSDLQKDTILQWNMLYS